MRYLLGLGASLLLALGIGCRTHQPLEVGDLAEYPKKLAVVSGVGTIYDRDQKAGEGDLFELLNEAKTEDAWVYIQKPDGRRFWVDFGQDEKYDKVTINYQTMVNYIGEGDLVVGYHTHLFTGKPREKDFKTHANLREIAEWVGATSPRAKVVMRGQLLIPDCLIEYRGEKDGTGTRDIIPKSEWEKK